MPKATLLKWGNSVGIRIPSAILKQAHLFPGEALEILISKKGILLVPVKNPQKGWKEAFNAIADQQDEELLLDTHNEFDEDEWTW